MFGKSQARILLRFYKQTLSNFSITLKLVFTSLQVFQTTFHSEFVVRYLKISSFFLDPLAQKLFFDKNN